MLFLVSGATLSEELHLQHSTVCRCPQMGHSLVIVHVVLYSAFTIYNYIYITIYIYIYIYTYIPEFMKM